MKKYNIKLLLTVNLINLVILGGALLLLLMEMDIPAYIALAVWIISVVYTNYSIIVRNTDMVNLIRAADKHHKFNRECESLIKTYKSINFHAEFFDSEEPGSMMKEAYDLIAEQAQGNINSAVKFMRSYNYITCPPYDFLTNICVQNEEMVTSLTKLVELTLKIDSKSDDVDLSYVNNLIQSLKELSDGKDVENE